MADPLSLLAPPVGPEAPAALSSPSWTADLPWIAGLVLAVFVLFLLVGWLWGRRRWARVLHAVRGESSPGAAAERLAQAARDLRVDAPAAWWQSLDAIRFSRASADHAPVLARLLDEAASFHASRGSLAVRAWRPAKRRRV